MPARETKNAFRGIFQLASARYTPPPGHPAPEGKRRFILRFPHRDALPKTAAAGCRFCEPSEKACFSDGGRRKIQDGFMQRFPGHTTL
jgi:hypothetical protein